MTQAVGMDQVCHPEPMRGARRSKRSTVPCRRPRRSSYLRFRRVMSVPCSAARAADGERALGVDGRVIEADPITSAPAGARPAATGTLGDSNQRDVARSYVWSSSGWWLRPKLLTPSDKHWKRDQVRPSLRGGTTCLEYVSERRGLYYFFSVSVTAGALDAEM